jgi:hypothetical protein
VKAATPTTTCQICGRAILANTGRIAHHGYRRPYHRSGIQTRSCAGARGLPYEVSCNLLAPAIAAAELTLSAVLADQAKLALTPPDVLGYTPISDLRNPPTVWVPRPEGFTPNTPDNYTPRTYPHLYANALREAAAKVRFWTDEVAYLKDRLAKWVPPATTTTTDKEALNG